MSEDKDSLYEIPRDSLDSKCVEEMYKMDKKIKFLEKQNLRLFMENEEFKESLKISKRTQEKVWSLFTKAKSIH